MRYVAPRVIATYTIAQLQAEAAACMPYAPA